MIIDMPSNFFLTVAGQEDVSKATQQELVEGDSALGLHLCELGMWTCAGNFLFFVLGPQYVFSHFSHHTMFIHQFVLRSPSLRLSVSVFTSSVPLFACLRAPSPCMRKIQARFHPSGLFISLIMPFEVWHVHAGLSMMFPWMDSSIRELTCYFCSGIMTQSTSKKMNMDHIGPLHVAH